MKPKKAPTLEDTLGYKGGETVKPKKTPVKSLSGNHIITKDEPLVTSGVWLDENKMAIVDFRGTRGIFAADYFTFYKPH